MRHYIGVDWADREHRIWIVDDTGTKVLRRTVDESAEGFADWGRWLDERRRAGVELWAAIERADGRLVDFLLDHGVVVFPVNPKAWDRARDRFRMSGSKSDTFAARVGAEFLRTDHAHLQALRPSSEEAQALKALTRDYARQVRGPWPRPPVPAPVDGNSAELVRAIVGSTAPAARAPPEQPCRCAAFRHVPSGPWVATGSFDSASNHLR